MRSKAAYHRRLSELQHLTQYAASSSSNASPSARLLSDVSRARTDSGVNIPDRARRSFDVSAQNRMGFGLGPAIVKQVIEAHGGTVHERNLPCQGCIFSIELPESAPT